MISGYGGVLVAIVCIHGCYILLHSFTLSFLLGTIKCGSQSFSIIWLWKIPFADRVGYCRWSKAYDEITYMQLFCNCFGFFLSRWLGLGKISILPEMTNNYWCLLVQVSRCRNSMIANSIGTKKSIFLMG